MDREKYNDRLRMQEENMQYRKDKKGNEISLLGYGCLRFSKKGSGIDIEKTERELMDAIRAGINYFDTAYVYGGSEAA